ncbi:MAG TPA: MerR family transcriptional regulator [Devosiaceae bacterium]|nr:MerR family transcriptional regulator [Devosiaceae bacterium]
MEKSPDAFRTISEAAEELDLPQHVLRFWETRFSTIKPLKRGGGRRYYRPEDVMLLKGIRHLLYDQGFTIKGVQRILKDQGSRYVIGIGEGKPVEPVTAPTEQAPPPRAALSAPDADDVAPAPQGTAGAMTARDREKLSDVLRELLDCKRLLERAREN